MYRVIWKKRLLAFLVILNFKWISGILKIIKNKLYDTKFNFSKLKFTRPGIVDDWIRNDKIGGFQYHKPGDDYEEVIHNLIPKMIQRIAIEILKGENFFNVTMPVDIFDNKSFLQVIAYWYSGMPVVMRQAAKIDNLCE